MRARTCVLRVCTASLTVCALHLCIIASFDEADVSQVEDSCNDLEHLSLDVTWDSNHVHGFLETAGRDVLSGLVTGYLFITFTQSHFFPHLVQSLVIEVILLMCKNFP